MGGGLGRLWFHRGAVRGCLVAGHLGGQLPMELRNLAVSSCSCSQPVATRSATESGLDASIVLDPSCWPSACDG